MLEFRGIGGGLHQNSAARKSVGEQPELEHGPNAAYPYAACPSLTMQHVLRLDPLVEALHTRRPNVHVLEALVLEHADLAMDQQGWGGAPARRLRRDSRGLDLEFQ